MGVIRASHWFTTRHPIRVAMVETPVGGKDRVREQTRQEAVELHRTRALWSVEGNGKGKFHSAHFPPQSHAEHATTIYRECHRSYPASFCLPPSPPNVPESVRPKRLTYLTSLPLLLTTLSRDAQTATLPLVHSPYGPRRKTHTLRPTTDISLALSLRRTCTRLSS